MARKHGVLIVADGDYKYGASHSLVQMAAALQNLMSDEIQITVVLNANAAGLSNQLEEYGCRTVTCDFDPFVQDRPTDIEIWKVPKNYITRDAKYWVKRRRSFRELCSKISVDSIDIVHSNSSREDFGALVANRLAIPLLWHIREFGDKDYNCISFRRSYIDYMNRSATKLVAVSHAVRNHWVQKGIDPKLIDVVYNGVPCVKINDDRFELRHSCLKAVFAGSLTATKGQWQMVQAMRNLPAVIRSKISVDIIGDGTGQYPKELKRAVAVNGLDECIKFLGYKTGLTEKFADYDVGLMCSKSEGFGRVTAEYMMAGLAVIASDSGANPEIVNDGVTGLLFRNCDINDLTNKIQYLIQNPLRIASLGRAAREEAIERFTVEKNAERIAAIYEDLLSKRRS